MEEGDDSSMNLELAASLGLEATRGTGWDHQASSQSTTSVDSLTRESTYKELVTKPESEIAKQFLRQFRQGEKVERLLGYVKERLQTS